MLTHAKEAPQAPPRHPAKAPLPYLIQARLFAYADSEKSILWPVLGSGRDSRLRQLDEHQLRARRIHPHDARRAVRTDYRATLRFDVRQRRLQVVNFNCDQVSALSLRVLRVLRKLLLFFQ